MTFRRLKALCAGGRPSCVVRTSAGEVVRETTDGVGYALVWAQGRASGIDPGESLTVEERSLFGDPIPVFRIEKHEDESLALHAFRDAD